MTEQATICGDGRVANREQRESDAYNLLGVAMDAARRLAAVLREVGCEGELVKYLFPSPISTDRGPTDAWAVLQQSGVIGATYIAADGQLYCHDRDDVVACVQGLGVGFDRVPHYVLWYRHLGTCVYVPAWVQALQEATNQMEAALESRRVRCS